MRKNKKKVILMLLLSMVLCSCQKEQVADVKEVEAESSQSEQVVDQKPEVKSEANNTANETTSDYDGTDPYQGTIKGNEYEDSMSIYDTISKEDAVADLTYFYDRLKERHPAWIDGSEDKTNAIDAVYQESMNGWGDEVSVLDLYQCTSKMAAILRDGHTRAFLIHEAKVIDMFDQVDEYGVAARINQFTLEELDERSKDLMSYELEEYRKTQLRNRWIWQEDTLALLGVDTSNGVTVTFQNGQTYHYELKPYSEINKQNGEEETYQFVSYELDEERNLGIFDLKECIYDNVYIAKVNEFFRKVKEKGITNIVVDLRNNGGGNSQVGDEFVAHLNHKSYLGLKGAVRLGDQLVYYGDNQIPVQLRKDAFDGTVYVLTNVNTFSAAMDFGMLIQDNGFGKIVGETSGNLPHCYIDCLNFQMPHSKLGFTISFKIHYRIDEKKAKDPLTPDILVDSKKALDKVYELIQK